MPMILEDYVITDVIDTNLEIGPKAILKYYPRDTKFFVIKISKDEADLLQERGVNVRKLDRKIGEPFYVISIKIRDTSDLEIMDENGNPVNYEDFVKSKDSVVKSKFKVLLYERDINDRHVANFILSHARITLRN
jgi:hypothetical protein